MLSLNSVKLLRRYITVLMVTFAAIPQNSLAQPIASEETAKIAGQVTDAFFAQLLEEDFALERAFLADSLKDQLSADQWREMRQRVITKTGATPLFRRHKLTFYQQDRLLAAVDYAAIAQEPDTYICGYVIWSFATQNSVGLARFEQNIVEAEVFQEMEIAAAIQILTQWRCPPPIIETVLNVTFQTE